MQVGHQEMWQRDFPGGSVVENPPSSAGDVALIPDQGTKISRAESTKPECPNYRAFTTTEDSARCKEDSACQLRPEATKK